MGRFTVCPLGDRLIINQCDTNMPYRDYFDGKTIEFHEIRIRSCLTINMVHSLLFPPFQH